MDKLPTQIYLEEKHITYRTAEFPDSTEKGTIPIAKFLGVRPFIVVKTLIFKGSSGSLLLCLTGGDSQVDFQKLKQASGEKDVMMANPQEIYEKTGYKIGAIPPFGLKTHLEVYIDESLQKEPELYVGAGKFGNEIILFPNDLQIATEGKWASIIK